MRKNYIVNIIVAILLASASLLSCNEKPDKQTPHANHKQEQYTCPMHPQIIKDQPGTCPVCGMELVLKQSNKELIVDSSVTLLAKPANEQVVADLPAIKAQAGARIISADVSGVITYDTRNKISLASRVSGRIERLLVKYNYQPVRKGQLIMEIYSPDLAAAQRELIFVATKSPDMLAGAKQRLSLLGMSPVQIEQVIKTGKILYRVPLFSNADGYILEQTAVTNNSANSTSPPMTSPGGSGGMDEMGAAGAASNPNNSSPLTTSTPVLIREGQYVNAGQTIFTIYQATNMIAEFALSASLSPQLKKGQKLLFFPSGNKDAMQVANIGLIEPIFRGGQNFVVARVYLGKNNFQAGQLLTGIIPIVYTSGYWLPKEAIWRLGNKSIVFKKENSVYRPVNVQTGAESGEFIQINTDISDWQVASNASYLIDSESFIKAKQ